MTKSKFSKKQLVALKLAGLLPPPVASETRTEVNGRETIVMERLSPQGLKARAVEVVEEIERRIRANYDERLHGVQIRSIAIQDRVDALEKFDSERGNALREADEKVKAVTVTNTKQREQLNHLMTILKKALSALESIADDVKFSAARSKARAAVDSIRREDIRAIHEFAL